jgi:hypothetical protein
MLDARMSPAQFASLLVKSWTWLLMHTHGFSKRSPHVPKQYNPWYGTYYLAPDCLVSSAGSSRGMVYQGCSHMGKVHQHAYRYLQEIQAHRWEGVIAQTQNGQFEMRKTKFMPNHNRKRSNPTGWGQQLHNFSYGLSAPCFISSCA